MGESKVDLGAGSGEASGGGEIGYYPDGPKVDLGDGAAKVAADIADLGPYLEGNYIAQLGLESLPLDRIFELKGKYNTAGFYSPQDASARRLSISDRFALEEMTAQGRDPSSLFDPSLRGVVSNPLKDYLSYSYPDASSGDTYVEPFDTKIGSRFSRPGEEFPRPKEEEYLDRDLTEEESRRQALGTLVHELTHAGDVALTRTLQADDEPYNAGRDLGENYARLIDIMNRDRGIGTLQSDLGREYEGRAVSKGIQGRYIGDPFETSVRKDGFFNTRERLDPKDFEKAVLGIPAQDAARRELFRRMAERTPTGGYAEGGPVSAGLGSLPASENILTSGSISMSPSKYPNVDPRTAALGSQLLKRAKIPGKFPDMLNNADPDVIRQINRIMARPEGERLQSPTEGISLLMPSGKKTS
jgi:hypothetical protein